jgi:hypothetical protein
MDMNIVNKNWLNIKEQAAASIVSALLDQKYIILHFLYKIILVKINANSAQYLENCLHYVKEGIRYHGGEGLVP